MGKLSESLKANGIEITEEIEKKVMSAFVEKKDVDLKDTKIADLEKQLKDRDQDIEALKKVDVTKLQEELTTLQGKYKTDTEMLQQKLTQIELDSAVKLELSKTNALDAAVVEALLNKSNISLKDGQLIGLNEQIEAMKRDRKFLFKEETAETKEGFTYEPKAGTGNVEAVKTDFVSIINENSARK